MGEAPGEEPLEYPHSDSDHALQQHGDEGNDNEDDPDRALFMSLTGGMSSVTLFNRSESLVLTDNDEISGGMICHFFVTSL